jgi:hypothetical protein
VYGPFFFAEKSVDGSAYLDMLQLWLLPQLQEISDDFILQQDGAPVGKFVSKLQTCKIPEGIMKHNVLFTRF